MLRADNGGGHYSTSNPFDVVNSNAVARPFIDSINASGDRVTLVWRAIAGRTYRVQFKSDLGMGDWTDLAGDITATAAIAMKEDICPLDAQRFYRVVVVP